MMTQQQETRRQNLEQERGGQAWKYVKAIQQKEKTLQKEYRSLARGLNAMIQINGLGQTLGFFKAKGKNDENKAHFLLLAHLTEWMQGSGHFSALNMAVMNNGKDGLLKWIVDSGTSSADYRRATAECLAFGSWLSRFAEAELEGED
ncbi:MAG: type III-B CRISPR module-associated protein Cmr5 [Ktedonobacteraceae bacterium]|nr:type III-B CRISPR module-associated protein Cmr5 [Ktedonobacteraceae bacterium]MBO0795185.1 type III-B CRISPR module-associated protein Cmr5 [Ktedonobacteraceae bacterium]